MSLDFCLESEHKCPHCGGDIPSRETVFWRNITHNLGKMAEAAGIYNVLWRPDESGYNKAHQIIVILETGLSDLRQRPEYYEQFNSPNGWGLYKHFVPFVEAVLQACKETPDANIRVSR